MVSLIVTPDQRDAIATKKKWEKVIGAVFNLNDEVNQIAQQAALNKIGMSQVSGRGATSGSRRPATGQGR